MARGENYLSPGWILLFASYATLALIFLLFTPYTHQLDEIKNTFLMSIPPFLLAGTVWEVWRRGYAGPHGLARSWAPLTMAVAAVAVRFLIWLGNDTLPGFLTRPGPANFLALGAGLAAAYFTGAAEGPWGTARSHLFSRLGHWRPNGATLLLGLYTATCCLSWLLNPYKGVGERVIWFQVGCATFTLVFAWLMDSEAKLRKTMVFFTVLALASTVIGLFLFAGQGFTDYIYKAMVYGPNRAKWLSATWSPWVTLFYTLAKSKAMYSSVLNEDFYAAFLVMCIPIPLAMFFVERRLPFKILGMLTFLMMCVCLVFTNSNDSFGSIILGLLCFGILGFIFRRDLGLSLRLLLTFVTCSAVLLAVLGVLMLPTLARTWTFKGDAINGRIVLWSGGFWPWLYHHDPTRSHVNPLSFLLGTGPGGYRHYFPVFRRADFFDNQINNVTTFGHNQYLDVLCETGLIGLFCFLGLYAKVVWDALRQVLTTASRTHRLYQMAALSGLVGISLQNFFSPNYRWAVCGTVFWSLLGLSMGIHRLDADPETMPEAGEGTDAARLGPVGAPTAPSLAPQGGWLGARGLGSQAGKWSLAALATLFLLRSPVQGIDYFTSAMANGEGLRLMDSADLAKTQSTKQDLLEKSADLFERAIELNPTFLTSYYKLAHVYNQLSSIQAGDERLSDAYLNKAVASYEDLNGVSPHYSEIHQNLAIMYSMQVGRQEDKAKGLAKYEQCWAEAQEAARQSWKPNVQQLAAKLGERMALLYDQDKQSEKALAVRETIKGYWRRIIDYRPKTEDQQQDREQFYALANQKLVQLAETTGKPEEAEGVLKQMIHDNPEDPSPMRRLLGLYDRMGRAKEKAEFLKNAIHDDPLDTNLHRLLADAFGAAGDKSGRFAELRKIERLDPKDKGMLGALYRHYREAGPLEAAKAAEYRARLVAAGVANPDADAGSTPSVDAMMPKAEGSLTPAGRPEAIKPIPVAVGTSGSAVTTH